MNAHGSFQHDLEDNANPLGDSDGRGADFHTIGVAEVNPIYRPDSRLVKIPVFASGCIYYLCRSRGYIITALDRHSNSIRSKLRGCPGKLKDLLFFVAGVKLVAFAITFSLVDSQKDKDSHFLYA